MCPSRRARPAFLLPAVIVCVAAASFGCGGEEPSPAAPDDPDRPTFLRLTSTAEGEATPALSPDGARVAFVRAGGVWVLDIASRSAERISPRGDRPTWTPGGEALVFMRRDVFGSSLLHRLIRVHLADGVTDTLSPDTVDVYEPATAPEDGAIAYRALSRQNSLQTLRVVTAEGAPLATLTGAGTWVDRTPAWSPYGDRLAFVRQDAGTARLWLVDADGDGSAAPLPGPHDEAADPAWTPDGGRLVYARKGEISWVSEDGGTPAPLVVGRGFELSPMMSEDGRRLVFVSNRSGNFDVWLLNDPKGIGAGPYSY